MDFRLLIAYLLKNIFNPTAVLLFITLNGCKAPLEEEGQESFAFNSSIRAIKAVSDDEIWFAGSNGHVGFTLDGGMSWNVDSISANGLPLHFRAIEVVNNNVFVASIISPAYFLKKKKGDAIWDTVYKETHPKAFYNCLKFWDDKNGIAVGDATDSCMSIVVTNDGGNTWFKRACDSSLFVTEGEANFAASNTNIATYKNHCWIATGGAQARIFYSKDYGVSWTHYPTPFIQGGTMTGIYSIDFYNEKLGFAIGGDWENKTINSGNKAVTKDGGQTWQLVADGYDPGYRSCVKFLPGGKGSLIAIGSTGISTSNDTGKTWHTTLDSGFYAGSIIGNSIWLSGNEMVKNQKVN